MTPTTTGRKQQDGRMTREEYRGVYLRSEHWRETRLAALERAEHRCQVCNRADRLDVHHRTYERIGAERAADLTVLCRRCHELFHSGSKVNEKPRAAKPERQVSAQKMAVRSVRCPRCNAEPGEKCRRKGHANHIERVCAHEGTDYRIASQHRPTPRRHLETVEQERKLTKAQRRAQRIATDPEYRAYVERMERAKAEAAGGGQVKPWDTFGAQRQQTIAKRKETRQKKRAA